LAKKAVQEVMRKHKLVVQAFAETSSREFAAFKAGYSPTSNAVDKIIRQPDSRAEIARIQTARLFNELLPLAVSAHIDLLKPETPAGARAKAVDMAYKYTIGQTGGPDDKDPASMTAEELARESARMRAQVAMLEGLAGDRARPIDDAVAEIVEPLDDASEPSIFD
jgi:hypothetical protein